MVTDLVDLIASARPEDVAEYERRLGARHAERFRLAASRATQTADEADWRSWLPWLFPTYFDRAFGPHHEEFWEWVWSIDLGVKPDEAFVGIWARGGGKSMSAEAAVVSLGARRRRAYCVYVSETQDQADDHVATIAAMLESEQLARHYPLLSARSLTKFGASRGWRRNRLHTADGFTVDALGLDTAARGMKIVDERPDLIVFDDIDSEKDGPGQTEKKIASITKKLLPAGADDIAVLAIQNLIIPTGVFARLAGIAEEEADFLRNRIVSGPVPAIEDATFDRTEGGGWKIVAGTATWEGQDLDTCQAQIDDWGYTAFLAEAQHDTDAKGGGMFDHVIFNHCERADVPALVRVEVWVDPAVTNTDKSDSQACQVDGLGVDGRIYRLRSWEKRTSPQNALKLAAVWAMLEGALTVGVETDQGGDTWRSVLKEATDAVKADLARIEAGGGIQARGLPDYVQALAELSGREKTSRIIPSFAEAKAGSTQQPKEHRVQQMLTGGYEKAGQIVHVLGPHRILERALFRFPARKPYDLADAAYWSWKHISAYGRKTQTSTGARKKAGAKQLPKVPITKQGVSSMPRVGFGRPGSAPRRTR